MMKRTPTSTATLFVGGLVAGTALMLSATGVLSASPPPKLEPRYPSSSELAGLPAGKQDAIGRERSAKPNQLPAAHGRVEEWADFADSGSVPQTDEIRSALVLLEEGRTDAMAMPKVSERASASAIAESVAANGQITAADKKRAQEVGKGDPKRRTVSSNARAKLSEVNQYSSTDSLDADVAAVESAYDDPNYPGYADSRFVVDKWIGVEVTGKSARALLLAHQEYSRNTDPTGATAEGWQADPVRRWQVSLVRSGASWKISDQVQHDLDAA